MQNEHSQGKKNNMRKATEGREKKKNSCVYVVVQRIVRENAAKGGQTQLTEGPKCQAKKLGLEAVSSHLRGQWGLSKLSEPNTQT